MLDIDPMRVTHLLHIRKTGGSAVWHAITPIASAWGIRPWPHDKALMDIPVGEPVVFCVRDPISRFVSGFNSRLRRGRPKNDISWTAEESWAFDRFPTPNDLAESLSSPLSKADAVRAMRGINHVRHHLSDWVHSAEVLRQRSDDIVAILLQENLDSDFEALKRALKLPADVRLPTDPVLSHRTPEGFSTHLSEVGVANLREWYAADFALLGVCKEIRARKLATTG